MLLEVPDCDVEPVLADLSIVDIDVPSVLRQTAGNDPTLVSLEIPDYLLCPVRAAIINNNPQSRSHGLIDYGLRNFEQIRFFVLGGRHQSIAFIRFITAHSVPLAGVFGRWALSTSIP